MSYTRSAAENVRLRAPQLDAGTIYSLTWPLVRPFALRTRNMVAVAPSYLTRPVRNEFDAALDEYTARAPSRRQRQEADDQAELLHGWDGSGAPPFDLDRANGGAPSLRYILPLAKWIAAGRPGLTPERQYATVIIDEGQDTGMLELTVALSLVAPGGSLIVYGDPGQALYAESKGSKGGALPAAWTLGGARRTLHGGYRCGDPLASAAARVLNPIWRRPASTFAAAHRTEIHEWWPSSEDKFAPGDLVLGFSRAINDRFISEWGLRHIALVPSVSSAARVTVCTGHAAKGAQAEDVYLLPWSKPALRRLDEQEPSALRLLYTMLTRASRRVHVPTTLLARMQ